MLDQITRMILRALTRKEEGLMRMMAGERKNALMSFVADLWYPPIPRFSPAMIRYQMEKRRACKNGIDSNEQGNTRCGGLK